MKKWILVLSGLMVFGCANSPKVERLPDSADATEEVSRFEKDMTESASHQSDILSPHAWAEASDYLKEAKDRLADQRSKERILYSVSAGRAWMDKANRHAEQAAGVIPEIMKVRREAIDANAPTLASDEFNNADKSFRQYARDRENSDFGIATDNRTTFRDNYVFAHTKALQNKLLGEARKNIHDAKEKGAQTLVPNVWENAQRSYKSAEGFIAANRLDEQGINEITRKATVDSRNLIRITDEAVATKDMSPEQRAIALDRVKMRNRNLSSVLDQQAFDQKYDEARQMFDSQDAEVYKQGNRLLLRLKGIEFPVGGSALPASSYPLITKVGGVIKDFGGSPKVRIEGHTDASGGSAVNQRLSQARAEAVKSYLISTVGLNSDQVEVVGVGDRRPLASNKTKEGRAANRRVDVIVMPEVQDAQIRQAQ